jgi:hypothetical protein
VSTQFPKFKKLHRPAANTQPVPADTVTGYRGLLPDEVLTQWRDTGCWDGALAISAGSVAVSATQRAEITSGRPR